MWKIEKSVVSCICRRKKFALKQKAKDKKEFIDRNFSVRLAWQMVIKTRTIVLIFDILFRQATRH